MAKPITALDLLASDKRRSVVSAGISAVEKRSGELFSSLSDPQRWLLNQVTVGSKSGAAVNYNTALTVSTVYACAQILSGTIARLPIKLYQKTAKGHDEIPDHPTNRILSVSPDGFRTAFAWRQMMEGWALLRGNGFSRIKRNSYFEVDSMSWLDPFQVEFWRTPDGDPFYRYRGEVLQPYEIFHHREFSLDGIVGISPVTCMREQIGLAISTQEHGSRFFSNGATPGVVITAPITATEKQMDAMRDKFHAINGGVINSNKPLVLYGGMDAKSIPLSMVDSQFLESRKFDVEEIARAFRVPLFLLQSTEKATSWGTGIESMSRGFVDYSLADRIERWEQELNLSLLTQKEQQSGYGFHFDLYDLLSGSPADRVAFYTGMRTLCAMDVNEIRVREKMNELPENIGNNFQLPFNTASGMSDGNKPAKAGAEAGD